MSHEAPLHVAVGVIKNSAGEILISRRDKTVHQGGLWEFPGGKVEPGENVGQALARELNEELNISIGTISPIININHCYPDLAVQLDVWSVDEFSGQAMPFEGQPIKWVRIDELSAYAFPAANWPIITALRLSQYYAILDGNDIAQLTKDLHAIMAAGIKMLQLRIKSLSPRLVEEFLCYAFPLCKKNAITVLVNSAVQCALDSKVDGLHLTSTDLMSLSRRPIEFNWVAASCHNLEELLYAEKIGVDFAVLAPVMPTRTHPKAVPLGWDVFQNMVSRSNIPVFALGGMRATDVGKARSLGGQGVAGIRMFVE